MNKLKEQTIKGIIAIEGGYVDNPNDSGGKTRYGITKAVARENGYKGKMKNISKEIAFEIYENKYWDALNLSEVELVSPLIAGEMADTAINMGVPRAGRFLQRSLNVLNRRGRDFNDLKVDAQIGRATLRALKAFILKRGEKGEKVLFLHLNALQGAKYIELSERYEKNEEFEFGWFYHRVGMVA